MIGHSRFLFGIMGQWDLTWRPWIGSVFRLLRAAGRPATEESQIHQGHSAGSYSECTIGHLDPIMQPYIGSPWRWGSRTLRGHSAGLSLRPSRKHSREASWGLGEGGGGTSSRLGHSQVEDEAVEQQAGVDGRQAHLQCRAHIRDQHLQPVHAWHAWRADRQTPTACLAGRSRTPLGLATPQSTGSRANRQHGHAGLRALRAHAVV
jgi:hypothetical protein